MSGGSIHGQKLAYFDNVFTGVIARQRSGGGHETMTSAEGVLEVDAWYTGPGILLARFGGETDAVQMIMHTPIEDGVTRIWHGLITRAKSTPPSDNDRQLHASYHDLGLAAFSQDFAIWRTKEPATRIMQVLTDGPFQHARNWYRQFYNPRTKASEFQSQAQGVRRTRDLPGCPHQTSSSAIQVFGSSDLNI
jgi:3-ketosteroid 9alpha-monooxygenase subunit A